MAEAATATVFSCLANINTVFETVPTVEDGLESVLEIIDTIFGDGSSGSDSSASFFNTVINDLNTIIGLLGLNYQTLLNNDFSPLYNAAINNIEGIHKSFSSLTYHTKSKSWKVIDQHNTLNPFNEWAPAKLAILSTIFTQPSSSDPDSPNTPPPQTLYEACKYSYVGTHITNIFKLIDDGYSQGQQQILAQSTTLESFAENLSKLFGAAFLLHESIRHTYNLLYPNNHQSDSLTSTVQSNLTRLWNNYYSELARYTNNSPTYIAVATNTQSNGYSSANWPNQNDNAALSGCIEWRDDDTPGANGRQEADGLGYGFFLFCADQLVAPDGCFLSGLQFCVKNWESTTVEGYTNNAQGIYLQPTWSALCQNQQFIQIPINQPPPAESYNTQTGTNGFANGFGAGRVNVNMVPPPSIPSENNQSLVVTGVQLSCPTENVFGISLRYGVLTINADGSGSVSQIAGSENFIPPSYAGEAGTLNLQDHDCTGLWTAPAAIPLNTSDSVISKWVIDPSGIITNVQPSRTNNDAGCGWLYLSVQMSSTYYQADINNPGMLGTFAAAPTFVNRSVVIWSPSNPDSPFLCGPQSGTGTVILSSFSRAAFWWVSPLSDGTLALYCESVSKPSYMSGQPSQGDVSVASTTEGINTHWLIVPLSSAPALPTPYTNSQIFAQGGHGLMCYGTLSSDNGSVYLNASSPQAVNTAANTDSAGTHWKIDIVASFALFNNQTVTIQRADTSEYLNANSDGTFSFVKDGGTNWTVAELTDGTLSLKCSVGFLNASPNNGGNLGIASTTDVDVAIGTHWLITLLPAYYNKVTQSVSEGYCYALMCPFTTASACYMGASDTSPVMAISASTGWIIQRS